jgi:hypothetical protein
MIKNRIPFPRSRSAAVRGSLLLVAWCAIATSVDARNFRVNQIPNGSVFGCANCHVNPNGGGARNAFGQAVGAITGSSSRAFWDATLAAKDSDGDGAANGLELGDPDGDGTAVAGAKVTNPGNASSKPEPVNQAPQVALTGPADGAVFTAPAVAAVVATATDPDGSIAQVEFFGNGRLLGTVTQPPFSLLVDWALGAHSVTAKATDNQGASTTSAAIAMNVNPPEAPVLTAPVRTGESAQLAWSGGGGPFALQSKPTVEDPWCAVGDVTPARTATVAAKAATGFYRVADLAVGEAISLSVAMSGAYERPTAVETAGTGSGTLAIQGNTLNFDIRYSGLSGPATLAHIHGPAGVDGTAGVMINLAPFNGGAFGIAGTLAGSVVLTAEQKAAILSGKTYVNVHTDLNKPGEIRGQVLPVMFQASLSGAHERPNAVATGGFGGALFTLLGDQLSFNITYGGLSGPATLAHIHGPADAEGTAGVMINLAPFNGGAFGVSGSFAGTVTLTPAQLSALAAGLTYVNVHTDLNKPGEIRGQILPCVTATPFAATLSGAAERPNPVTTDGTGSATAALEGDILTFHLRYAGLSGPATLAHIHGPADAAGTAGVMINLAPFNGGAFGTSGTLSGRVPVTAEQKAALLAGLTYFNIHTDANKPGEIRGQVLRPVAP